LALVMAFIVINKVGSPQFMLWLVVPVIAGILTVGRRFLVPAVLALALAALTQVVYPYLYGFLLLVNPAMVLVLTVRNALEVVLLVVALRALWKSGSRPEGVAHADRVLGGAERDRTH
jgi:hypothetical protein